MEVQKSEKNFSLDGELTFKRKVYVTEKRREKKIICA